MTPHRTCVTVTMLTTDVTQCLRSCVIQIDTLLYCLQAKAAAAVCEDNQAATTADGPREGGSPVDKRRQAGAYNEQHEGLPSSAEERKEGQPLGPDGQAERQPSGAERQAEDAELEAARGVWQVFQDLLPVQRYWWQKLHFR